MTALVRPCSAELAVTRAKLLVGGNRREPYVLGTGDFHPAATIDEPFSKNSFGFGCDCWGFAGAWCYKLPRHRAGYNKGPWATVADDLNCDSAIEQAEHKDKVSDVLWEIANTPKPGDLIVWPSIRGAGGVRLRIGHVAIVLEVPAEWDWHVSPFGLLQVAQCGSSRPSLHFSTGKAWEGRDWFKGQIDPKWRTRILRSVP